MASGKGQTMSKIDIKQSEVELRNIDELSNWEDNPRTILQEDFERLKKQIKRLGMYKPLLVNHDNIVLGGNMRLRALRDLGVTGDVYVTVVEADTPEKMLEYALSDNDAAGVTDDLKLAEVYALHPIDTKLFKVAGSVLRPLESIINPTDPATLGGGGDRDKNNLDESLDGYLNGNIKQIVLYYPNEEYADKIAKLEKIGAHFGLENNTDTISKLIEDSYAGIITEA